MESRVNYTVVGLFVVLLTLMLIGFAYWLTTGRHAKTYRTYLLYMNESVYGLSEEAVVQYNGVPVGYVEKIELVPDDLKQVKLSLQVQDDVPITETTEGSLKAQGITGLTYIGLEATTSEAPLLKAEPGERYPIIKSTRSFLIQLSDALRELSHNLTSISKNFQKIFDDENTYAFKDTMMNIKRITEVVAENSSRIDSSFRSASTLLENTAKASEKIPDLTRELDQTLASVKLLTKNLSSTSDEVRKTMHQGQTAIQGISHQAVPEVVDLLNRLKVTSGNLEELTSELKQNPAVLLRGRQPQPNGPGE